MTKNNWTRNQLLIAFNLYCQIPFGKLHKGNSEIIRYAKLIGRTPSALAMKLCNIASLDPAITKTGRKGLEGASLTDKKMWSEMQANWTNFFAEASEAALLLGAPIELPEINDAPTKNERLDYSGRYKIIQTTARVGQRFFRNAVLSAYQYRCCVTGLNMPKLLVASHIIPWSEDEKNRLNPQNGLCLNVLHDKAFDLGIMTISAEMTIKIAQKDQRDESVFFQEALLSYAGKSIAMPEKFHPHTDFLEYHRQHIFLG